MPDRNSSSWNFMISRYYKLGDILSARLIFDYNFMEWAMIDGYCKMDDLKKDWDLFDRMGSAMNSHLEYYDLREQNVKPTEVTMVSLLPACAHLGALDIGKWIHAYIRQQNLRTDVVFGNALIEMYDKCGSIEAAFDVFHGLPT
ncbi:pentatricopeptide repeat-containing protein At5g08305-like [Telopea speciosissima]|uniref:pentatricopeptide repeat-containing protein At5g08305-like n=1 Tax=Telopea speciosissima TaxID=54955 RepID=UPI001CC45FDE|nr:pentatricopeptide repeat-containing protein At5g08305-like [Telopea speciosissima]